MVQVIAVGERTHGDRNFLAQEEVVGIVLHHLGKVTVGEREMPAIEARSNGAIECRFGGKRLAPKHHHAFRTEAEEAHELRRPVQGRVVLRIESRKIRGEYGLRAFFAQRLQHVDQKRVPSFDEAVMRVELKRVPLAAVLLLQAITRPACALRHHVRHVDQFHLRRAVAEVLNGPVVGFLHLPLAEAPLPESGQRFIGAVLPADDNAQPIRFFCLVDQVEQGGNQFRIAIARNLHKDRVGLGGE